MATRTFETPMTLAETPERMKKIYEEHFVMIRTELAKEGLKPYTIVQENTGQERGAISGKNAVRFWTTVTTLPL